MKIHTVQLNLEDFDNGTSDLSPLEFAIYTRLFLASYNRDLPDDDEKLARIARCKVSEIKKCRNIIDEKFYKSENFLKNFRTESERTRYQEISKKNKNNAHNRWKIAGEGMPTASNSHTQKNTSRNATAMLPNNQHLITNKPYIKTPTPIKEFLGVKKNLEMDFGEGVKKILTVIDIVGQLQSKEILSIQDNCKNWDIEYLAKVYVDGINSGSRPAPRSIQKAFPAWCLSYTKGKKPN